MQFDEAEAVPVEKIPAEENTITLTYNALNFLFSDMFIMMPHLFN